MQQTVQVGEPVSWLIARCRGQGQLLLGHRRRAHTSLLRLSSHLASTVTQLPPSPCAERCPTRTTTRADEAALIAFTRDRLAHYKSPTSVSVLPELPRNATGKILKRQLRSSFIP